MKKILAIMFALTIVFGVIGCSNSKEITKDEIADKVYVYEGEGAGSEFYIMLRSDGTFQYYAGMLSSYIGMGTWEIDEDNIICMNDNMTHKIDGTEFVRTNYFLSIGNELTWIADGSDNFLYVKVEDGEKFFVQQFTISE